MPLSQEQFESLVSRLEREATRSPALYKFKLGAFASLGYVYVAGVLVGLIGISVMLGIAAANGAAALIIKLIIPLVVLVGIVLRSLWVKLQEPQGLELVRSAHPDLFAALDEIRSAAQAPELHKVLLTNELNAAIVQVPRLGMFGWQKNFLILGLPLLQLLSLEEIKAVLAHEFGHLSGAHGRFGAWIYRVRAGWARLAETLSQDRHWGSFLFVPFFEWYAPKFAAYSFVQARQQEYEADRVAARSVGAKSLGDALVRLNLKSEELATDFWPSVYRAADENPTPSSSPFASLLLGERRGFLAKAPEVLRQSLQRNTDTADTHPCLRDRLAAMQLAPEVPQPVAQSAATALFGAKLPALVEHFDNEWRTSIADWWRGRHDHVKSGRAKLETYRASATPLGDVERFEYAMLLEEFGAPDEAFEIYKSLVLEHGAKRGAKFAYGRMLLDRGDASGVGLLEEVMTEMPETVLGGCDLIVGYLKKHGRDQEATPFIERFWLKQQQLHEARVARETVRVRDNWLPHELAPESVTALKELLARHSEVKAAWLVRKEVREGEPPLHVVGVQRRSSMFKFESSSADQLLVNQLATEVRTREQVLFIWVNGDQKQFRKVFKRVSGSQIR